MFPCLFGKTTHNLGSCPGADRFQQGSGQFYLPLEFTHLQKTSIAKGQSL